MASVDTKHPEYTDRVAEWQMMRHTARGAQEIAAQGELYLPMPSGFRAQSDLGKAMYAAYATRAQFPNILAPTLRGMVGVIHRVEAQIEGLEEGQALAYLWEKATPDGLPLEALHRRITAEVLLMGRYALLTDVPAEGGQPYLASYAAETLINWSDARDFFVLDESGLVREEFQWREQKRYRVLILNGAYSAQAYGETETDGDAVEPKATGGTALREIPFVVMGPRDLAVAPDEPPLIGVARASLALYRLDADYRHQLFSTGQETLVIINGDAPAAVGAGVVITLKGDQGVTPDAKYVGPTGTGIDAHRVAIQDERANAVSAGSALFDNEQGQQESGEARKLRLGAQRATLT